MMSCAITVPPVVRAGDSFEAPPSIPIVRASSHKVGDTPPIASPILSTLSHVIVNLKMPPIVKQRGRPKGYT